MKLREWIDSVGGQVEAARLLKVSPAAVCKWLALGRVPLSRTLFKIHTLSGGRVSIENLIIDQIELRERSESKRKRARKKGRQS